MDEDGNVISLVTSHAKQADGQVIPSLNFSIAAGALRHIREFVVSEDMDMLRRFDSKSELLSSLWQLQEPPDEIAEGDAAPEFFETWDKLPQRPPEPRAVVTGAGLSKL